MDQNNPFRNRDQDSLVAAVRAVLSGKPNEAQEKVEQELEKAEAMDPVNPQAVKKKFKDRKDKDIDNDGDVDGSDEYLHKRRKAISKAVKEAVEDNPANRQHLCAKNVVHENWGEGVCIPTMHADPDAEGNVEWYDIMFEHGIETRVSIDELKVTKAESHNHGGKKKKMAENDDMEDDDDEEENGKKKKMNGKKDEVDTEPSIDDKKDTAEAKEMTDAQMKRREEIVKGMKDKMPDFKKKYGDRAKDVMYATATKMAMKEGFELTEEDFAELDEATYSYKAATFNGNVVKGSGSTKEAARKDAEKKAKALGSTIRKRLPEEVDLDEAQRPYVSSDRDGKHVMNAAGKIEKSFKDMESASNYLRKHYKRLAAVREEVELTEMEGQPAQKDKDGKFIKKPGYVIKLAPGKGYIYRRETGPVRPSSIGRDGGMSGRAHGPGTTGVRR